VPLPARHSRAMSLMASAVLSAARMLVLRHGTQLGADRRWHPRYARAAAAPESGTCAVAVGWLLASAATARTLWRRLSSVSAAVMTLIDRPLESSLRWSLVPRRRPEADETASEISVLANCVGNACVLCVDRNCSEWYDICNCNRRGVKSITPR
jgi:hypothetical protein